MKNVTFLFNVRIVYVFVSQSSFCQSSEKPGPDVLVLLQPAGGPRSKCTLTSSMIAPAVCTFFCSLSQAIDELLCPAVFPHRRLASLFIYFCDQRQGSSSRPSSKSRAAGGDARGCHLTDGSRLMADKWLVGGAGGSLLANTRTSATMVE